MGIVDSIGLTRKINRPRQRAFFARFATDAKVLDIGCGNDLYGDLFPNRTTLDIAPREGVAVDIIADAHDLSAIADASFDVVLCAEVLEHLHDPPRAVAEFHRVLRPGGLLLLSTRFIFPLHDVPGDYYRFTKYGLRHILRSFDIEVLEEESTTIETLAILCQRLGFQCETVRFRPFKLIWFLAAQILRRFSWILSREYGDIGHTKEDSPILTSGYFVEARKRTQG